MADDAVLRAAACLVPGMTARGCGGAARRFIAAVGAAGVVEGELALGA